MDTKILVIGASGSVGFEIAKIFSKSDTLVRIGARNPERAKKIMLKNIEIVHFDYSQPETFKKAFEDIDRFLLVTPPPLLNLHKSVCDSLDAAKSSGINYIVNISALGIESNDFDPFRLLEEYIQMLGFSYTFLKPNCYMQNFNTLFRDFIRDENQFVIPSSDSATSFVDMRDVAETAVKILNSDDYNKKEYTLTGQESLTFYVIASLFSEILKTDIVYKPISKQKFQEILVSAGWPDSTIEGTLQLCDYMKSNSNSLITNDLSEILGRKPTLFRDYIKDYIDNWI